MAAKVNMKVLGTYTEFVGNAEELAAAAVQCGAELGWTFVDSEKLNERLVRYYAAEGVMDKPDRLGRDAMYQFRHLLQLLTARRMQEQGTSLATIGAHNLRATTKDLLADLGRPPLTAAELLVRSFAVKPIERSDVIARNMASPLPPSARPQPARPPVPQPDLAAEVEQMREEFKQGMQMIEQLCTRLEELTEAVRLLAERAEGRRKESE
jgi:DNA-binding transcriptional MerR regulator